MPEMPTEHVPEQGRSRPMYQMCHRLLLAYRCRKLHETAVLYNGRLLRQTGTHLEVRAA